MKTTLSAAALAAFVAFVAFAAFAATLGQPALAAGEHAGHAAMAPGMKMQSQAPAAEHWVDGQVKKVDRAGARLTLAHGPLTHLGMDMAMTMAFGVKDPAWLDQLKVGDKIRFVAADVDGALTVVKYEALK